MRLFAAALAGMLCGSLGMAARVTLLAPSEGRWIARDQPVVLRLTDRPPPSEGRLAIFVGTNDVTDVCAAEASGDVRCSMALLPMPQGEQEIAIYLVKTPTDWQELARLPIRVLNGAGLEVSEVAPRLDLDLASRLDHGGSANVASSPGESLRIAGNGGVATRSRRNGWELRTSINVVGASSAESALRYPAMGEQAPKVDLSEYLVELDHGDSHLAVGHVSFGDEPLLLSGMSHRGVCFRQKVGGRVDLGVTAQSGRIVSGYDDVFGVTADSYIAAGSAGFELLKNHPRGLRLDTMFVKSEAASSLDFDTGHVPDAESSRGYGVRLSGETPGGRWRGSAAFAKNRYTNPYDPLLSQGLDVVPVREQTSAARALDLAVNVLQNHPAGGGDTATVTLGFQHRRFDPLYRTLGGPVTGDQESDTGLLTAVIGPVAFQVLHTEGRDNLDEIPTLLTTRTSATMSSLILPLRSLFPSADGRMHAWLPDSFFESWSSIHQKGTNRPPSFNPLTHIPDQETETLTAGLSWSFAHASLAYQFVRGQLDNRQPDRALADFEDVTHVVNLGVQAGSKLRFGLVLTTTSAEDRGHAVTRHLDAYTFDLDWRMGRGFGFRGNATLTETDDTKQLSDSRSWTTLTQVDYRFPIPLSRTRRAHAQVYLRYVSGAFEQSDRLAEFSSQANRWSVIGGFSVGLF